MPLNNDTNDNMQRSALMLEKHIKKLSEPAKKTVALLITAFKKSKKRLQNDILNDDKKKSVLQNKLKRLTRELEVLKTLTEHDIILFALTTTHKLMAIAANKRMPIADRLKARVASHKPLSSHILRVKSKLNDTEGSETDEQEDDSETEMPSNSLDKIALNNQIVKMRKDIKRAKVHIIHKLTRNVTKLQKKKTNEKIKEKFERKTARWVEKIKCIKELYEDDVSRFALLTNKDMNKLAVDIKSSVKTQSMATIAAHKFVAVRVDSFRKTFPDWEKTAPKILMKKKKKRKLNIESKDSVKNKEVTDPSLGESSDSEEGENVNEISYHEEESDENENSEQGSDVEDETEDDMESDKEDTGNQSDSNSERGNRVLKLSNGDLSESSNESDNNTTEELSKTIKVNRNTNLKTKLNFKPETKTVSDNTLETSSNTIKVKNVSLNKIKKPKDIPKIVDPFFITSTNEEYVTSQVPVEVKEDSNKQVNNQRIAKFSKLDSKVGWKSNRFDSHDGMRNKPFRSINRFEKMPYPNKGGQGLGTGNRKERRQALRQPAQEEKIEKLHPSWEAKKKLSSIASFQGKKITFD